MSSQIIVSMALFAISSALVVKAKSAEEEIFKGPSEFRAQNPDGRYAYAYLGGPSAKYEHRTKDGIVQGTYSYIDTFNKLQTVNYRSEPALGLRVAQTNLPQEPEAVVLARAAHLKAYEQAYNLAKAMDGSKLLKKNLA